MHATVKRVIRGAAIVGSVTERDAGDGERARNPDTGSRQRRGAAENELLCAHQGRCAQRCGGNTGRAIVDTGA